MLQCYFSSSNSYHPLNESLSILTRYVEVLCISTLYVTHVMTLNQARARFESHYSWTTLYGSTACIVLENQIADFFTIQHHIIYMHIIALAIIIRPLGPIKLSVIPESAIFSALQNIIAPSIPMNLLPPNVSITYLTFSNGYNRKSPSSIDNSLLLFLEQQSNNDCTIN